MRSRALSLTLGMVVMIGGAIFGVTPAQAQTSDCRAGHFCMWNDERRSGALDSMYAIAWQRGRISQQYVDRVSSVFNNSPRHVRIYQDYDQGGKFIQLAPGDFLPDLRGVVIYNPDGSFFDVNTFNDRASSYYVI
ncbi:peptidase inhibitor family I36 protein [Embleya sp. NPDC005575]|uniref:peptidase inhibitor family I36 protein n=1 Tax=Embleya sp. NPDC005575 TaxID=3156892 RepID=UPI0033B263A2